MGKWYVEILQDYHTYKKRLSQRFEEKSVRSGFFFLIGLNFMYLAHSLHNLVSAVMDISLFHWRLYFSLWYFFCFCCSLWFFEGKNWIKMLYFTYLKSSLLFNFITFILEVSCILFYQKYDILINPIFGIIIAYPNC